LRFPLIFLCLDPVFIACRQSVNKLQIPIPFVCGDFDFISILWTTSNEGVAFHFHREKDVDMAVGFITPTSAAVDFQLFLLTYVIMHGGPVSHFFLDYLLGGLWIFLQPS